MIKDSEIGFALLYNSIETHCNPRSKEGTCVDTGFSFMPVKMATVCICNLFSFMYTHITCMHMYCLSNCFSIYRSCRRCRLFASSLSLPVACNSAHSRSTAAFTPTSAGVSALPSRSPVHIISVFNQSERPST